MLTYKSMVVRVNSWTPRLLKISLVRFCIVGVLGFWINFVLLTGLYKGMGTPLFIAQLMAGEIALFNNFLLHHHWTYRGHNSQKSLLNLLVQFHATSWAAILGTALVVSVGVHYAHLHYFTALLIAGVVALCWNFVWSKYVIWRRSSRKSFQMEIAEEAYTA